MEGYVANPALLDGGLQIFLYHLLRATDIFAMPRRAVGGHVPAPADRAAPDLLREEGPGLGRHQ